MIQTYNLGIVKDSRIVHESITAKIIHEKINTSNLITDSYAQILGNLKMC